MTIGPERVSRRDFVAGSCLAGAGVLLAQRALAQGSALDAGAGPPMEQPGLKRVPEAARPNAPAELGAGAAGATLALPPLPYAESALAPYISAQTVGFHYGKHHKGYVEKTNELVQGSALAGSSLEEIVKRSARQQSQQKLFHSAAQAWNHAFYWQSMRAQGGGVPSGALAALAERIGKDFGSYPAFRERFIQTAVDHFSNGWVWLVLERGKLKIVDTHDADTPLLRASQKPLLASDVWEHAYYLDYKNAREAYATAYVDHLLNWEFVTHNLGAAHSWG